VWAALASVALAAVIAVTGYVTPPLLLAVAVALVALVLGLGWPGLLDLPAPTGTTMVVTLTGWAAAALGSQVADVTRPLAPFTALLALGLLISFGHELSRRGGRPRLVESLTGTVSGQVVALLGGGWLLLPATRTGTAAIAAVAAAVVGARLAALLPVPAAAAGWVALAVGSLTGSAAAVVASPERFMSLLPAVVCVAGVTAGLDRLLVGIAVHRGRQAVLAAAAAPVLAAGTVGYVVARLVG
jgi:hypothetical protein